MKQRCEYCDSWIEDTDEVCPHCGAPNAHMMASAEGVPKTIEELQAFCKAHNLPLEDMRFFIGEDYQEPRAFGIYRDGEDVIVYKNKANGERAVRYRGHDEAYAVNELYQKMKSEIANQRMHQAKAKESEANQAKRGNLSSYIVAFFIIIAAMGFFLPILSGNGTRRGYYGYDNATYYYQDSSWYYWDSTSSDWVPDANPPETLTENADDYYTSSDWDSSGGTSDFSESPYYVPSSDTDDDWDDDDWDWDSSDSWDSGSTDWDSDW